MKKFNTMKELIKVKIQKLFDRHYKAEIISISDSDKQNTIKFDKFIIEQHLKKDIDSPFTNHNWEWVVCVDFQHSPILVGNDAKEIREMITIRSNIKEEREMVAERNLNVLEYYLKS